jgi:hypothetical protein
MQPSVGPSETGAGSRAALARNPGFACSDPDGPLPVMRGICFDGLGPPCWLAGVLNLLERCKEGRCNGTLLPSFTA